MNIIKYSGFYSTYKQADTDEWSATGSIDEVVSFTVDSKPVKLGSITIFANTTALKVLIIDDTNNEQDNVLFVNTSSFVTLSDIRVNSVKIIGASAQEYRIEGLYI